MRARLLRPLLVGLLIGSPTLCEADDEIASIDTYGLVTVNRDAILEAAGIQVGDRVPDASQIRRIAQKLQAIPGIDETDISVVRVGNSGTARDASVRSTVYIGVREAGSPKVAFRAAPSADVSLPREIVGTYEEFERRLHESMRGGDYTEDDSNGYALLGDEATRAVQRRFIPLAERHIDLLIEVLRTARNTAHRRIAAAVLAFAGDKTKVAKELAVAARDPDAGVRNNAMRALGVIVSYAHKHPELAIVASIDPYLDLVESVEWTDRNKAMFVLLGITENCDGSLLNHLAKRSLPSLVEMARWNTEGHALVAYLLVGRIAHMTESELLEAWGAGQREAVISRALDSASKSKSDTIEPAAHQTRTERLMQPRDGRQ